MPRRPPRTARGALPASPCRSVVSREHTHERTVETVETVSLWTTGCCCAFTSTHHLHGGATTTHTLPTTTTTLPTHHSPRGLHTHTAPPRSKPNGICEHKSPPSVVVITPPTTGRARPSVCHPPISSSPKPSPGAVAFVLAVYSNPSAGGNSLGNSNTELVKAMNDVSAIDTPKPGAKDKARQHLINGDDTGYDDEYDPEAMDSCGKGATCSPSPPPTWRAHDGISPTVDLLTAFPTPTPEPSKPVQPHKDTPAPQPVWHFPTKSPTTSQPTLEPTPTPAPTYHKAPSYDWPTYEPTVVPTISSEPTGNANGNTPKPTHGNTPKPTTGDKSNSPKPTTADKSNSPKPTHKHYEPTPAPTREKKPAHSAPTLQPTKADKTHPAPVSCQIILCFVRSNLHKKVTVPSPCALAHRAHGPNDPTAQRRTDSKSHTAAPARHSAHSSSLPPP